MTQMEIKSEDIKVLVADASHEKYVDEILETISAAAKVRGTGIAKRTHEYVAQKMREGKAVIALHNEEFAGFCYIESWGNKQYVANSGLIVADKFRRHGLAKRIKKKSIRPIEREMAQRKTFWFDKWRSRNEDKHRTGIRTGAILGTYRRRGILEGMPRLCKP